MSAADSKAILDATQTSDDDVAGAKVKFAALQAQMETIEETYQELAYRLHYSFRKKKLLT